MAKPGYVGANVVPSVDTFRSWMNTTNSMVFDMSTIVVTTEANSTGGTTSGNAHINGIFGATTLYAGAALRGGTVSASANLTVTSNVIINSGTVWVNGANATFTGPANFGGFITANAGANLGQNVTISNTLTANQIFATGTKSFGSINSISFTEFANNSNNLKVLRQNTGKLELASIALSDLSDANTGSPTEGLFLKYIGGKWTPAALDSGGTFSANNLSSNTFAATFTAQLGALSVLGNTGFAVNVSVNSTSSVVSLKANTISFSNSQIVQLGNTTNVKLTGGANSQFLQLGDSTNGNLSWVTIDREYIFPNGAVTTVGANVISVDRINGRVGFGTNTVPASYVVGILGNLLANGSVVITGNTSVTGNVSASTFIGALAGLASNASALNGKADSFFQNASNINTGTLNASQLPFAINQDVSTTANVTHNIIIASGFIPVTNSTPVGNATNRVAISATTGNFANGISVAAASNFGNNDVTGMRVRGYKEFVNSVGTISVNAVTLDLSTSNIFDLTLANNSVNVTISNPPASGNAYSFTVIARQDATGNRALTWPVTVKWPGGVAPSLTNTASKIDILNFMTVDGGASYFGGFSLGNL